MVDDVPPAAIAAAARSCERQADNMIDALTFQGVTLRNCQARM